MTLPLRPPVIVHHMGALEGAAFPPNSLETIQASLQAGASFIEIDVTALHDTDYLLVHDPDLESGTTGQGAVGECSLEQARPLRFRRDTQFHVPVLSEVVQAFLDYGGQTRLQIDFKNVIPFPTEEPLQRFIGLIRPLGERVLVSTEADWQLRKLRSLAQWLDLGFDIHFYLDVRAADEPVDPHQYPKRRGAYGYWDDHVLATQRIWPTADYLADRCRTFVSLVSGLSTFYISHPLLVQSLEDGFNWASELHGCGIKLDAWTLDTHNPAAAANAKRLLDSGVDQFTTNTPRGLTALLRAER